MTKRRTTKSATTPEFRVVDILPRKQSRGRPKNPVFDRVIAYAKKVPSKWVVAETTTPKMGTSRLMVWRSAIKTREEKTVTVAGRTVDDKYLVFVRYDPK